MKVLLVGAEGQLGRSLQQVLVGHELRAFGHPELDITDLEAVRGVIAAFRPALVLNAAAWNDVDGAETHPREAYRVNAVGPRNLAIASAEHGAAVLHVSTDFVFDGRASRPYHEYDRTGPLSVYGASKLAGEDAVRVLNPRHYIVRTAWVYAPWGRNFPLQMLRLAEREPRLRIVADRRGSPTFAPHLAAGIAELMQTGAWGTYHLAGRGEASWHDVMSRLVRQLRLDIRVEAVSSSAFPLPAARPLYSVLTTIQSPEILLPRWEEGVDELARALQGGKSSVSA